MAAIYLIRHGQASFGSSDYDALSDKGKLQATALGEALVTRGITFDAAYAGTLQRHAQTAAHCLGAMASNLQPLTLAGLNEYDHEQVFARHLPELPGTAGIARFLAQSPNPHKTFQKEFEKAVARWRSGDFDPEYSETWSQFRNRCCAALKQVRETASAKSIAVFSSGGPIAVLAGHTLGLSDDQIVELNWAIMNCSITCLLFNADKISLRYFNDFAHFENCADKSLLTYR